jgi:hypothetical protein
MAKHWRAHVRVNILAKGCALSAQVNSISQGMNAHMGVSGINA